MLKKKQLLQEKHPKAERLMGRHRTDRLPEIHPKAEHLTARHPAILPEADSAAEAAVRI